MPKPAKRPAFNAVIFGAYPPKRTASAAKRKDLAYMERAFGFLHLHGAQNNQELPPHVVVMQFSAAFSAENQVMVMTGEPVIQALAAFNADRRATLFISLPPQCDEQVVEVDILTRQAKSFRHQRARIYQEVKQSHHPLAYAGLRLMRDYLARLFRRVGLQNSLLNGRKRDAHMGPDVYILEQPREEGIDGTGAGVHGALLDLLRRMQRERLDPVAGYFARAPGVTLVRRP